MIARAFRARAGSRSLPWSPSRRKPTPCPSITPACSRQAGPVARPSRTYDEAALIQLDQINVDTISGSAFAWILDINTERGMEASPLVIDGVLYNIQPWNIVTAYDADRMPRAVELRSRCPVRASKGSRRPSPASGVGWTVKPTAPCSTTNSTTPCTFFTTTPNSPAMPICHVVPDFEERIGG